MWQQPEWNHLIQHATRAIVSIAIENNVKFSIIYSDFSLC